jgi:hypothetical protein
MIKPNYNYIYTDQELELLKNTFAENEPLLKLLRKVFLPRISDSAADIGGMTADVAMHPDLQVKSYPTIEQAMVGIEAHTKALQHVESCLWKMKQLAGLKNETVEELKKRLEKDSTK